MILLATSASADTLSRKWHSGFGDLGFNRTAEITTFHTPSGTFRVSGEFSSGERIFDTKFTTTVRVTTSKGAVLEFSMNERVPATKGGGTEVRYKSQDFQVPGKISSIYAKVDPNITTPTTVIFRSLPEVDPVDICAGYVSQIRVNVAGGKATVTKCNSSTGEETTDTKVLEQLPRHCDNCPLN